MIFLHAVYLVLGCTQGLDDEASWLNFYLLCVCAVFVVCVCCVFLVNVTSDHFHDKLSLLLFAEI